MITKIINIGCLQTQLLIINKQLRDIMIEIECSKMFKRKPHSIWEAGKVIGNADTQRSILKTWKGICIEGIDSIFKFHQNNYENKIKIRYIKYSKISLMKEWQCLVNNGKNNNTKIPQQNANFNGTNKDNSYYVTRSGRIKKTKKKV